MMRKLCLFREVFVAADDVSALEVGQAFFELHHQAYRLVDQTMSSAGLSLARSKVLMRLSEGGPMNQATLAGLLGFAPRSVTDTVDGLERDGMVTRTEDKADRRARIVALTSAGRDALAAAQVTRGKAMDDIFGSLSVRERATLRAMLTTIRTNLPSGDSSSGH
jgi:DNA-binding MarR family transcriptional regulator